MHTRNARNKAFSCIVSKLVDCQMCGADGAHPTVCLDVCSGYEAFTDEDTFAYRYYTVRTIER